MFLSQSLLSGCSEEVDKSLVNYINKTKNQKTEYVKTTLKVPELETFQYSANNLRDPFEPFFSSTTATDEKRYPGEGPDLNRPREPLEAFAIETLQMVGTLEKEGTFYGLLRDNSGMVYRVNVGNYVGSNSGKIERISGKEIEVKEWLSDGKGGWREHMVIIPFSKFKEVSRGE